MAERLRSHEKAVYRMINAALLTSMALLGAVDFLGTGGRPHLFTALAMVAVLACLNFTDVRGRLFCAAVLLGLGCAGMAVAGWREGFAFLRGFPPWVFGGRAADGSGAAMSSGGVPEALGAVSGLSGTMDMSSGTASVQAVPMSPVPEAWIFGYGMLQSALVAAVCYALEILFEKLPLLKRIFAAMICAALLAAMALRWEIGHFAVVFLLAWVMLACGEWIQSRWEKMRKQGNGKEAHTFWIMPFVVLYLLLMAAMPVPEEPYDWMWAKNICNRIGDAFMTLTQNLKWGSREGFSVAFSGFSEEGTLGGDLRQDREEAMSIWVQPGPGRGGPEHLYLTGSVADTFDGRSWSLERQGLPGESFLDTAQTLYAVRRWNREYQKDYLREISLDIRYEDFKTGFLFAPVKTWKLEDWDGRELDYVSRGEELHWSRRKGYGTKYRVQYFAMNLGRQEVDLFLERMWEQAAGQTPHQVSGRGLDRTSEQALGQTAGRTSGQAFGQNLEQLEKEEGDESLWADVLLECRRRNEYEFTVEDIDAYREAVCTDYLQEVELSPEVETRLEEMTEGAGTRIEKLRAIESGLAALSYTRTPGDLPQRVTDAGEFLDYFLLESREGYCTYFATAFVLLARAEGIPARYVQGYCVPVQEGRTSVDSGMAHAWPEAYLDGVGWVPFEPTPGYGGQRYAPWELQQPREGSEASAGELELPGQEAGAGDGIGMTGAADSEADGPAEGVPEEEAEESGTGQGRGFSWRLPGLAALAVLLACAAFWILDGILYRHRYRKMGPEEKLRAEVFRNLEILRWFGLERKPWETLQEAAERAGQLPGLEEAVPFKSLESYESAIYGGKQVSEDMIREAIRERGSLLEQLRARRRWAYAWCCLRMHLTGKER